MTPKTIFKRRVVTKSISSDEDFVVSIFFVERTIALDLRNIEKILKLTKVGLK